MVSICRWKVLIDKISKASSHVCLNIGAKWWIKPNYDPWAVPFCFICMLFPYICGVLTKFAIL